MLGYLLLIVLGLCSSFSGAEETTGKNPIEALPKTPTTHVLSKNRPVVDSSEQGLGNLGCSAISDLIRVNGNRIPSSFRELVSLLDEHGSARGGVERVIVPFSQAPGSSGLARPRVLIKVASNANGTVPDRNNQRHLNLNDRFFAALTSNTDGSQTLEFISWNKRRKAFDFGVIENFNNPSRRRVVSNPERTQQCLACHRTGGPIFPVAPWSTTSDGHRATQMAMIERLGQADPEHYREIAEAVRRMRRESETATPSAPVRRLLERGLITNEDVRGAVFREMLEQNPVTRNARLFVGGEDTGVKLFNFSNLDNLFFDPAVRTANNDLLLHQATQSLSVQNRRRFVREGMQALAASLFSENGGREERATYQRSLRQLISPVLSNMHASRSDNLRNFSPSTGEELADEQRHDEANPFNEPSIQKVLRYDQQRQAGRATHRREMSPTSLDAFSPASYGGRDVVERFGDSDTGTGLESILGITAADRDFIRRSISFETDAHKREIISRVLASRHLEQLAQTSNGFPTREQFLRTLSRAVEEERARLKLPADGARYLENLQSDDACLTSEAPQTGQGARAQPSGNCRSCHVGGEAVRPLPFDPENRTEWTRRLSSSNVAEHDAARRLRSETIRRLTGDGARMPPTDSNEATNFTADQRRELIEFLERQ